MHQSAHIYIPNAKEYIDPSKDFTLSFAKKNDLDYKKQEDLGRLCEELLGALIRNSKNSPFAKSIKLDISRYDQILEVTFTNRGAPLYGGYTTQKLKQFKKLKRLCDHFRYKNNGRKGQQIISQYDLATSQSEEAMVNGPKVAPLKKEVNPQEIIYRELAHFETEKLAGLFFNVYGHDYIHEDVYYPEKMSEKISSGELTSIVAALPDGEILGHVGLLKLNKDPAVYETALGVVNPTVKSQGLFYHILKHIMELVEKTEMRYCVYEFVTNHDFSQREVFKYPVAIMSIQIGCQISETQAKLESLGLGHDCEDMDRYSLLMAIRPRVTHPFGKEVILPAHIGEVSEEFLTPLGISWLPASRFFHLNLEGEFTVKVQEVQKAVYYDFKIPGHNAVSRLVHHWKKCLKLGYQYAAVDIPLHFHGIGQLYDLLSSQGFFIAGFIPYQYGEKLAARLQSLGPTRVSWENVKVHGAKAQRLLHLIEKDYNRNV